MATSGQCDGICLSCFVLLPRTAQDFLIEDAAAERLRERLTRGLNVSRRAEGVKVVKVVSDHPFAWSGLNVSWCG